MWVNDLNVDAILTESVDVLNPRFDEAGLLSVPSLPTNGHDRLSPVLQSLSETPPASRSLDAEALKRLLTVGVSETKFVLPIELTGTVSNWARANMRPDDHADPAIGDGYLVRTLYLDTPTGEIFRRAGIGRYRKFRVRRYGQAASLWLEMKWKHREQIRKRRILIAEHDLEAALAGELTDCAWFARRVARYRLQPSCQVSYRRQAYLLTTPHGPLRLTLDQDVQVGAEEGWQVPRASCGKEVLTTDASILELKYRGQFPVLFRDLVEQLKASPRSFSKYRHAIKTMLGEPAKEFRCQNG